MVERVSELDQLLEQAFNKTMTLTHHFVAIIIEY
jgi:hypothetical protein